MTRKKEIPEIVSKTLGDVKRSMDDVHQGINGVKPASALAPEDVQYQEVQGKPPVVEDDGGDQLLDKRIEAIADVLVRGLWEGVRVGGLLCAVLAMHSLIGVGMTASE